MIWLTGLPASGKITLARALERRLFERGCHTMLLDGDAAAKPVERSRILPRRAHENIRRAGEVARLFFEQGNLVLCAFVSPFRADRSAVRALLPAGRFLEVFVSAPVDTCIARDPKGLYGRAREGELSQLTGVGASYEAPHAPDIVVETDRRSVEELVGHIVDVLMARGLL